MVSPEGELRSRFLRVRWHPDRPKLSVCVTSSRLLCEIAVWSPRRPRPLSGAPTIGLEQK
jgi:hypothetical protein